VLGCGNIKVLQLAVMRHRDAGGVCEQTRKYGKKILVHSVGLFTNGPDAAASNQ